MTMADPTCYRHPDRTTYVQCTRCQRYICPECMRDAAVGHQCEECVRAGARTVRQPQTQLGGRAGSTTPIVTYGLIALNVLVFVAQSASSSLERELTLSPRAVAADGDLYRLITSAFLHYGITHLLFNMWALYVVGPPLEMWLGRLRFGALYVLSALGGSVLVYLLAPLDSSTAGASGAVFGLFAATFVVAKEGQRRRPVGSGLDRDQPRHHIHRPVDQLAGTPGRADNGRAGRRGVRVRAPRAPQPGTGGCDGRHRRAVRRAHLVADKPTAHADLAGGSVTAAASAATGRGSPRDTDWAA